MCGLQNNWAKREPSQVYYDEEWIEIFFQFPILLTAVYSSSQLTAFASLYFAHCCFHDPSMFIYLLIILQYLAQKHPTFYLLPKKPLVMPKPEKSDFALSCSSLKGSIKYSVLCLLTILTLPTELPIP